MFGDEKICTRLPSSNLSHLPTHVDSRSEVGPTILLALGQSHVQGLGHDDAAIHLRDGPCGFPRGSEADEAKPFGTTPFRHHLHIETRKKLPVYKCTGEGQASSVPVFHLPPHNQIRRKLASQICKFFMSGVVIWRLS